MEGCLPKEGNLTFISSSTKMELHSCPHAFPQIRQSSFIPISKCKLFTGGYFFTLIPIDGKNQQYLYPKSFVVFHIYLLFCAFPTFFLFIYLYILCPVSFFFEWRIERDMLFPLALCI